MTKLSTDALYLLGMAAKHRTLVVASDGTGNIARLCAEDLLIDDGTDSEGRGLYRITTAGRAALKVHSDE